VDYGTGGGIDDHELAALGGDVQARKERAFFFDTGHDAIPGFQHVVSLGLTCAR
jgi:hypothetical protein